MNPSQVIREWELKHLPFSVANGEIGVNGRVNRSVIVSRYTSQIERMFNTQVRIVLSVNITISPTQTPFQFTIRKPSRELTYIEEEEEERLPEIKVVTNTRASRIQEAEIADKNTADDAADKLTEDLGDENKAETKAPNVTIVNLERTDTEGESGESGERLGGVKDQDRHVRFTSKVEEIDFNEIEEVNEKTS